MNVGFERMRRSWLTLVLVITLPLMTSALIMLTVDEPPHASNGQPELQAALVNNDQFVTETVDGQSVPLPAGRMLVGELVTNQDDGFSWTITDQATAAEGLVSGTFSAIVTIPQNFSAAYISSTTDSPEPATLTVQTDGSHSYLAAILAQSLAANLPAALSTELTQGFVNNLLLGYTAIGEGLTQVASGANELTVGLNEIAQLAAELPTATKALTSGSQLLDAGLNELATDLWKLAAFGQQAADSTNTVADQVAALSAYVNSSTFDPTVKAEILAQLSALTTSSSTAKTNAAETDLGIDLGALAADALKAGSGVMVSGSSELAAGMPLLSEGISGAAAGSGALSSGLSEVAQDIPSYTDSQAKQLSTVVANPVETERSTNPALPQAIGAVGAAVIPLALWLGALALGFVRRPFATRALSTRASNLRIVTRASTPFIGLAVAQAALVILGLVLVQLQPAHTMAFIALIPAAAVSFALLHQGLTAVTGSFAWVVSIALLALQVLAAGVVLPSLFVPDWVLGLGHVLPLSQAIIGAQETITGGSLSSISTSMAWLLVAGVLGILLTLGAVARGRRVFAP